MKKYITKEDIKIYLQYGPMEFCFKKAMLLYLLLELPLLIIINFLFDFIKLYLS